jgi:hypothetical protein
VTIHPAPKPLPIFTWEVAAARLRCLCAKSPVKWMTAVAELRYAIAKARRQQEES